MFLFLYLCSFGLSLEFNVSIDLITWYSQSGNNINHVLFNFVFTLFRNSHRRCFIKKTALKNFAIFSWKHLCLILIRSHFASALQLYQKDIPAQVFFCDCCEIFKNTYLKNNSEWLLLFIQTICSNIRIVS